MTDANPSNPDVSYLVFVLPIDASISSLGAEDDDGTLALPPPTLLHTVEMI